MWTYQQSTGAIWRNNDAPLAHGYAGADKGINDPAQHHVRNVGPLPRGLYRMMHPAVKHPRLGQVAIQLEPDPYNEMFGRSGLWIHGDNARNNRSASQGCPIFARTVRDALNASHDRWLVVVA